MMKYVWLQFLLAISLYICRSQVCKLKQNYQNLLQMNEKETYLLYLQDYFIGDGLTYSLNDNKQYLQINLPEQLGGIQGEPISLIPKPKKVPQLKEFLLLLKVNEENYEIHSLKKFSKKKKFSASEFVARFNSDQCNYMNQFDHFFIITCLDYAQQQINYLTFDSDYQLINTFNVKIDYAQKESKIISKTAGQYLCTLINNGEYQEGEYISNYSNLMIFQLEKTTNLEDSNILINLVKLNQIQIQDDFITGFEIVKEGYLFISYFNLGVQIHFLNQQKQYQIVISLKKGILGISAQKISYGFYEYNIVCWDEQKLSNFLYDPSKNKIISRENIIQTTQINLLLNFVTNVFINEKYIVVSNINGISIYPTIINNINEGKQLYYYPSKSTISYFINIIDYLISIEEQQLILYIINDPLIKIKNIQYYKTKQFFQIKAITNQFDKPQVECPILNLYFQVQQEYQAESDSKQYYDQPYEVNQNKLFKGVDSDIAQYPSDIKIKVNCNKIQQQQIKQNQIIIRNQLEIQPKIQNSNQQQITFDKIHSELLSYWKSYYLSEVAYLKQQQLYQYDKDYKFKEKYYLLVQSYFSVQLQECLVDSILNCINMHTQNIEVSNRLNYFIFNIHNDYVYIGFTQAFGWMGYDNLEEFSIQISNILIYSYKLNDKIGTLKKYQISHFQHNIHQLEIIDDRLYMRYKYNSQWYIFTYKIDEITETLDVLKLSHKANYCGKFAFNIEYYGQFLYYFTIEVMSFDNKDKVMVNYLNIINIENGKFEQVNKIIYATSNQEKQAFANYICFTKDGVYISTAGHLQITYFTRSDFFSMTFTQSSDKNFNNFQTNQITIPFLTPEQKDPDHFVEYFSSEKYFYYQIGDSVGDFQIFVYNMRSTTLNCLHYLLNKYILMSSRKAFSLLNNDIFSIHMLENMQWRLQGLQIQLIKHEPLITINCQQNVVNRNLQSITIPFVFATQNLLPDQYPVYKLIIDFDQEEQEENKQNQIDSVLKKV